MMPEFLKSFSSWNIAPTSNPELLHHFQIVLYSHYCTRIEVVTVLTQRIIDLLPVGNLLLHVLELVEHAARLALPGRVHALQITLLRLDVYCCIILNVHISFNPV